MAELNGEIIIHDGSNLAEHIDPVVDGEKKKCGTTPRDYAKYPTGYLMCAKPFDMPIIPQAERADRLADLVAKKGLCSDIRNIGMNGQPIPSRDQNGKGYCWAHSGVSANLVVRAYMGLPYADLSAYAVACIIKGYRDEGGFGAEGVEWEAANGVPTSQFWPQQSMNRSNDTPEMRANAALHKIIEWMDGEERNVDQMQTACLSGIPGAYDFNWWSHSVGGMDLVNGATQRQATRSRETGKLLDLPTFELVWGVNTIMMGMGLRIWNSWGDSWSQNGMGILTGTKAIPDGIIFPRVIYPSAA